MSALVASFGDTVQATVLDGSMLAALPLAVLAGLVSFASPCVLPLVPGYLGYVGGMVGAGARAGADGSGGARDRAGLRSGGGTATFTEHRGRTVLGVALFILGFTVVFVALGVLAGSLGGVVAQWGDLVTRVLGVVVIVMGLVFLGWLPFAQRTAKVRLSPSAGLWGAPVLGLVFGLGWTPCIGPTLVAVYTLALDQGSAARGAILSVAYCLGLGLPFLLIALGFERSAGALGFLRTHRVAIMRVGGGILVLIGLALVTGLWSAFTGALQGLIGGFETAL